MWVVNLMREEYRELWNQRIWSVEESRILKTQSREGEILVVESQIVADH